MQKLFCNTCHVIAFVFIHHPHTTLYMLCYFCDNIIFLFLFYLGFSAVLVFCACVALIAAIE